MVETSGIPGVIITANGTLLRPEEIVALGDVRILQRLSCPALCELTFHDPPGPLSLPAALNPGSTLRVTVAGFDQPLFVGEVTAAELHYDPKNGRMLRIRGYDLLHRLRKRQSVRAHVQVTLEDLAQDLTADLGIAVSAAETGPLWQRLIQHQGSDLQFLAEAMEQCGLYMTLRDGVLHVMTLAGVGNPIPLELGEQLLEAKLEVNGESSRRKVTALGWNPLDTGVYQGRASNSRVGRSVAAEVPPGQVGGTGELELVGKTLEDYRHAEAVAQGELDNFAAREVTFWGIAGGDPSLRPGTPVDISGVAEQVAGRFVLTSVNHTIDGQKGYISEIGSAPPVPDRRLNGTDVAPGIVTRVDDPQGLGRIKVSLQTYQDVETEWLQVLSAGAGSGKGLVVLPDVGDQVLVLFPRGDPAWGIVLGGLFGMQGSPDSGVEGNAVRRYSWSTPGGQRLIFDDARSSIRIEDRNGSYFELAPGKVTLHSAVDLDIDAPGKSVVIRGNSIDFRRA